MFTGSDLGGAFAFEALIALVAIPLAVWKAIEIGFWVVSHISISWG